MNDMKFMQALFDASSNQISVLPIVDFDYGMMMEEIECMSPSSYGSIFDDIDKIMCSIADPDIVEDTDFEDPHLTIKVDFNSTKEDLSQTLSYSSESEASGMAVHGAGSDQPSDDESEQPSSMVSDISEVPDSTLELIHKICTKSLIKRLQIDDGTYQRTGPGRKRQNDELKSPDLKVFLKKYVSTNLKKLVTNSKSKKRMDAAITGLVRIVKKACFVLLQKVGPRNMYKRKLPQEYVKSFAESCVAFMCSINQASEQTLVESFIEYSVIYFPIDKCSKVIDDMIMHKSIDTNFLESQKFNLLKRKNTDKGNVKRWAQDSNVFKHLLELALESLHELRLTMRRNEVLKHLIKVASDFVS
jgi:hypothetical protein